MAITKLVSPNSPNPLPPAGPGSDWEKLVAQVTALKNVLGGQQLQITNWINDDKPALAKGTYIQHNGAVYVVDTEDYELSTPLTDGTWYLRVTEDGETLVPSWVDDNSGYLINIQYNGIYKDGYQLLPYKFIVSDGKTVYKKYRMLANLGVYVDYLGNTTTDTININIINTDELFSNSIVTEDIHTTVVNTETVNTGDGGFKIGQNLRPIDDVEFDELTLQSFYFLGKKIYLMPSSIIKDSFSSPGSDPRGLAFNGVDLISCDAVTDKIYVHDGISSSIKSSFSSPKSDPSGLTFDGVNLISCDYTSDRIYVHDGISSSIKSSFSSPSSDPRGLTFDGTNLISCDANTDRIYIHDGISSSIISSFSSPNVSPTGLAFDGINLISCDSNTDRIYIHDGISDKILYSFSVCPNPFGLTFAKQNLLLCDPQTDIIYRYSSILSTT